jgi:glycosyltransferase involved in cell wall biosynthesis
VGFYEAMDAFVLSSFKEGLPNVVLEAMAIGVPVVSTRVAGVARLIQDGHSGLLVEAGSDRALVDAVTDLAHDAARRDQLARAGRETIESRYSFPSRMHKIRRIYDRLLGGNRSNNRQKFGRLSGV